MRCACGARYSLKNENFCYDHNTLGLGPVGSGAGTFSYRKPCCEVIYTETHRGGDHQHQHQYQYGRYARGRCVPDVKGMMTADATLHGRAFRDMRRDI